MIKNSKSFKIVDGIENFNYEETKKNSNNLNWLDNFKKNQNISEINRNIVDELIKDIYIFMKIKG